jgi:uncharacterized protein (TIGR02996 family)
VSDRRAQLEAAIDEDPSDPRLYAVLGDYLQERGDPRGELIALQLAGETRAAEQHLRAHPELVPPDAELSWRNGFVHRMRLTSSRIAAVLDHPSCRWIDSLELARMFDLQDALDDLAARPRVALRELEIGTTSLASDGFEELLEPDPPLFARRHGAAVARLSKLVIGHENLVLERIELPSLVELRLHATSRSLPNTAAIVAARWPALERLDLRLDYATGRAMADQLRALVTDTHLPRLVDLGLHGPNVAAQLLGSADLFASHHALARLRSLDLSNSLLTDEVAGRLAAAPLSLERLDVSRNELTVYGIRALSRIASTVVADDQYSADDADPDLYDY